MYVNKITQLCTSVNHVRLCNIVQTIVATLPCISSVIRLVAGLDSCYSTPPLYIWKAITFFFFIFTHKLNIVTSRILVFECFFFFWFFLFPQIPRCLWVTTQRGISKIFSFFFIWIFFFGHSGLQTNNIQTRGWFDHIQIFIEQYILYYMNTRTTESCKAACDLHKYSIKI